MTESQNSPETAPPVELPNVVSVCYGCIPDGLFHLLFVDRSYDVNDILLEILKRVNGLPPIPGANLLIKVLVLDDSLEVANALADIYYAVRSISNSSSAQTLHSYFFDNDDSGDVPVLLEHRITRLNCEDLNKS